LGEKEYGIWKNINATRKEIRFLNIPIENAAFKVTDSEFKSINQKINVARFESQAIPSTVHDYTYLTWCESTIHIQQTI
jgi:hypothetical protein